MWVCEVYSDGAQGSAMKVIRGPVVHIGRKPECDISFVNDKSVSRNHAELVLANDSILCSDLNSKFCSYLINGTTKTKIEPSKDLSNKVRVPVNQGDMIQVGATSSRIRIRKLNIQFLPTKLDKTNKERLKKLVKSIPGGRIISQLSSFSESSNTKTYIITSGFSATIKILEGIAYQVPIITLKWVEDLVKQLAVPVEEPPVGVVSEAPSPIFDYPIIAGYVIVSRSLMCLK